MLADAKVIIGLSQPSMNRLLCSWTLKYNVAYLLGCWLQLKDMMQVKIILVSLSICFLAVILWLTSRRHRLIGLVAEQVARLSAKSEAPTIPTPTAPRITARRGSMVLVKHFHRTGHQHHLPPTGAYAGTGAGATLGRWHSFKLSFGTIFLIDFFENNNK